MVFNCLPGAVSLSVLEPLPDSWATRCWSTSRTPSTSLRDSRRRCLWCNTDCLAETIPTGIAAGQGREGPQHRQRRHHGQSRSLAAEPTDLFLAGNDEQGEGGRAFAPGDLRLAPRRTFATSAVSSAARGWRCTCPLWLNLMGATRHGGLQHPRGHPEVPPTG